MRLFALAAWMEEVTELRDSLLPIMSDVRCQGSTLPGGAPPADTYVEAGDWIHGGGPAYDA